MVLIDFIVRKSRIKEDTAIGLILSVFFGFGILLLTVIQHSGNAAQSGLENFLFGKAASLVGQDLVIFAIIGLILILSVAFMFKEFTIISFDKELAQTLGLPVNTIELVLTTLTVLAVVIGIQAVGVVLMAAILITPAAAARFWSHRVRTMVILSALFGGISGLVGAYISFIAPAMPTGPWIVVVVSTIALFSFFLAPKKGIVYKLWTQYKIRMKMNDENILKALYQIGEKEDSFMDARSQGEILRARAFETAQLSQGLNRLRNQGFLSQKDARWAFTVEGKDKGQRVVRLHRLWELYLTEYLRIAPDHVHEDADTIEHIITPELEKRLEKLLEHPELDQHRSKIPY